MLDASSYTFFFLVLMRTIGKNIVFIKFSAAANFLGQKRIALENFEEHFFNCSNKENKQEIEIFAFVRKAYNMVSHQIVSCIGIAVYFVLQDYKGIATEFI